jgi:hypothetical protein
MQNIKLNFILPFHRLPGIVVEVTTHDGLKRYKVAVVGGVLNSSYLRKELVHELKMSASAYGLEDAVKNWRQWPRISIRTGVAAVSLSGGQGYKK